MQGFNPELQVGMQAMVVNVTNPKNTHLIGKMVVIEDMCDAGPIPEGWYDERYPDCKAAYALALVTGIGHSGGHREGCATIQQKHLMPLPPLDDDAIIFADEQTKETEKCS